MARRPAESLEAYLPRFTEDGVHAGDPADLSAASRADEVLDRTMLAEKARAGLDRLPDAYRDAFVLRDLEEVPTEEVAVVVSSSGDDRGCWPLPHGTCPARPGIRAGARAPFYESGIPAALPTT
jgi:hypothetical protein